MIQPTGDRVLVKPLDKMEKSDGGIFFANPESHAQTEGVVIATGNGHLLHDGTYLEVEVGTGDRVIYKRHSGTEVFHGETKYLILSIDDILAINFPDEPEVVV